MSNLKFKEYSNDKLFIPGYITKCIPLTYADVWTLRDNCPTSHYGFDIEDIKHFIMQSTGRYIDATRKIVDDRINLNELPVKLTDAISKGTITSKQLDDAIYNYISNYVVEDIFTTIEDAFNVNTGCGKVHLTQVGNDPALYVSVQRDLHEGVYESAYKIDDENSALICTAARLIKWPSISSTHITKDVFWYNVALSLGIYI